MAPMAAAPAPAPVKQVALSVEPVDRNDAIARVIVCAKYLRQQEPFNPASYLMLRGLRWGELRSKGDQIDPYHAPWTVTGNIEYDLTLAGNPAYARVDDEFRSRNPGPFTFQNPNSISYNTNSGINPSTNLLNFRLGTIVHGWDIAGFAKNLLNTQPELFVIAASDPIAPHGHAYTETPRTIGVTTSYRW